MEDKKHKERIECKDGSYTLYNTEFKQAYHSPLGAAMEAREKYAFPCDLKEKSKQDTIHILDVCFGFGYNSAAAIEEIQQHNKKCNIVVEGFELDKDILKESLALPFPFTNKKVFLNLANQFDKEKECFEVKEDFISMTLFIGDVKKRIDESRGNADVVFFDPFSPKMAPDLWTVEMFEKVAVKMKKGAILATYSCARHVRENMQKAGLLPKDGPVVGRRGPATLAIRQ